MTSKRETLELRARIVQLIRAFFIGRGYLEVETPHRIPAPAPEAHIDAIPSGDWWLQTSPELCMKSLLAAGHPNVYQICRCFRAGERGTHHLPEFTMLEWYRAGVDYRALMEECEHLALALAAGLGRGEQLSYAGRTIGLSPPWPRITVAEAFTRYAGISARSALRAGRFDETVVEKIEPKLVDLGKPVFLIDYPAELAALARRKPGHADLAQRFELYIGGLELANAFSELADPAEQTARFEREREARRAAGKVVYPWPASFLRDLQHLPEAAGIALGVDRLVMLFVDTDRIDDVVAFVPEDL